MINFIFRFYRYLFVRKIFHNLNKLLYLCSLRGLGILNYESNYLSGEGNFLLTYLKGKTNLIIFDVGANIGNYSCEVFKINPSATIYAFEPHPKTFQKLIENVQHSNFFPNNFAVGHVAGTLSLYDYEDNDGSSHASLFKDVIETIHKARSVEHKVSVITLDAFIKNKSIDMIDLLKIDTEGNELNVIKGILENLSSGRVKAIHFEFNEMNVSSRTYFRDFWNMLPHYDFYRMLPDGLVQIKSYSPVFCEIFAYQNIVAVLKDEKNK